ncbi:MAG: MarR family transcriptional regulator [Bulleidia sp.]|nr:MarR family transcriptional regulator [Bulleidia sp.]
MTKTDENVLNAWVKMLMAVNSEKRISGMTFNEAVICHLLYRNPEHALTAAQLCRFTNMQKSLMNRTLTCMEEKHLIERTKSDTDRRKILITLNMDDSFSSMHEDVLGFVGNILAQLNPTEVQEAVHIFNRVAEIAGKETL